MSSYKDCRNLFSKLPGMIIAPWSKLYRREIYGDSVYPYTNVKFEDTFTACTILEKARIVVLLPNYLYVYRIERMGSAMYELANSRKIDINYINVICKYMEDYYFFAKKYQLATNVIVTHYRKLYCRLDKYDVNKAYNNEKIVIKNRLNYFRKNCSSIRFRYKMELFILCKLPSIYRLLAGRRV